MADVDRIRIYRYCPRCAAEAMSFPGPQLARCGACGLHLYYNPCAAVGAFIVDSQERVLFIRRAKDPGAGKLGLPGGFIDNNESAEDGLRREVMEEVGLTLGPIEFLCSQPNVYPYGGVIYPTLDFYFIGRVPGFDSARALDGVDVLVIRAADAVTEAEMAFVSLKAAWKVYRSRPQG